MIDRLIIVKYLLRFTESIRCFIREFLFCFLAIECRLLEAIFPVILAKAIEAGNGRHENGRVPLLWAVTPHSITDYHVAHACVSIASDAPRAHHRLINHIAHTLN